MKKVLFVMYKVKVLLLYIVGYLFPDRATYNVLLNFENVYSIGQYINARKILFQRVEKKLQKKANKKIRIIMTDCCEWCMSPIYNFFVDKKIDIAVIIVPFCNGKAEDEKKIYEINKRFCEDRNIVYYEPYSVDSFEFSKSEWETAKGDVYIYTNPWMGSYPKELKINNISLAAITCYIPYGFLLMKGEQHQFNQISHNLFTYIFCQTKKHFELYGKYCKMGNSHVRFTGHPKMDCYYQQDTSLCEKVNELWKGLEDNHKKTKIIYSPHWNFAGGFATFLDNGIQVLEYAEAHADTTSWIYKPHPLLEGELISKGYMTREEYSAYVKRWENASNAKVYLQGDYGDFFISSDAMINDSVSFIAEYMYTHKTMLLLQNGMSRYNEFGEECVKHVYTCKGNDFAAINEFVENVQAGKDPMKREREAFLKNELDYYSLNQKCASDSIIEYLLDILGEVV